MPDNCNFLPDNCNILPDNCKNLLDNKKWLIVRQKRFGQIGVNKFWYNIIKNKQDQNLIKLSWVICTMKSTFGFPVDIFYLTLNGRYNFIQFSIWKRYKMWRHMQHMICLPLQSAGMIKIWSLNNRKFLLFHHPSV